MRAAAFERLVAQAGYKNIQIEAGSVGLVVYGPTIASVAQVTAQLAGFAKLVDSGARAEDVCIDADEPTTTRFVATVRLDWNRVPESRAA
jgi:hypothetical protein